MAEPEINVDAAAFQALLDRIAERATSPEMGDVVLSVAEQGAGMVSGVPQRPDGGELAQSIHATRGRNPTPFSALIVSDVRYARFVFGGVPSRGQAAQPPSFPAEQLAGVLADRVAGVLFR